MQSCERKRLGSQVQDPYSVKYISYMMHMLHCNPSSIINAIKGMALAPTIAQNM